VLLVAASEQRRQLGPAIVAGVIGAPVLLIGQRAHGAGLLLGVGGGVALAVAVAAALPPAGLALGRLRWPAIGVLSGCVAAAGWLLVTQHRAVSGLDASWTERIRILHGAGTSLVHHLWWGAGPDPIFVSRTMTGAPGIASFAHNEPLEIALSVGLVGLALVVGLVVLAVRNLHRRGNGDLRVVAVALLLAGLVDFVWHFPVLGLVAGIVLGSVPCVPSEGGP
jgi:O-antigen ligase